MAKPKNDGSNAAETSDLAPLLIDVSKTHVDRVRADLVGRLGRFLAEWGYVSYEPGHIAGIVGDIKALDSLAALRPAEPPSPPRPTPDEERESQKRAHDEHKRQMEREERRRRSE